jgi:hypothetical protein
MLMSLPDPQSITVSGATSPLPRVSTGKDESEYRSADGLIELKLSHQYKAGRARRMIRVDQSKLAPSPLHPDENEKVTMGIYMVIDLDQEGFTNTEALALYTGFKTLITASSDSVVSKALGGES